LNVRVAEQLSQPEELADPLHGKLPELTLARVRREEGEVVERAGTGPRGAS
jgi:hypothetical protein